MAPDGGGLDPCTLTHYPNTRQAAARRPALPPRHAVLSPSSPSALLLTAKPRSRDVPPRG